MSRKTQGSILLILILWLAIACNALGTPTPTKSLNTPTISPTEVIVSPAIEVTSTTPTLDSETQRLKDIVFSPCLTISPEPPGSNQISGLLLVERAAVYAIDPNTGGRSDELIPSPEKIDPFPYDFALSPDGKWIAYVLSGDSDNLIVEPSANLLTKSSQGRIIWHPKNMFQLQGWLSNEAVVLRIYRDPDGFASTLIRNPFKQEEQEFYLEQMPDYLSYLPGGLSGLLFAHSNLMPDPTMKRVVYPSLHGNDYYRVALWDVENKKVVTNSLRLFFDWAYNDPLWSLDGSDFLIMGVDEKAHEEWFQVTKDGAVKQLTHVGEFLEGARFGSSSRSPDGRYLAFLLWKEDSTYKARYIILDLKTQSLDGFCIDSGGKFNPDKPFTWSPDGQYVAITNGTIAYKDAILLLVDLEQQKAFEVGKDVEAIGWMVKP